MIDSTVLPRPTSLLPHPPPGPTALLPHPTAWLFRPSLERRWELRHRTGTGLFVVSEYGTLLFRVDLQAGVMYAFDKKAGAEVAVSMRELFGV